MPLKKFIYMLSEYTKHIAKQNITDVNVVDNIKRLSISEEFWIKSNEKNYPFASNFKIGDVLSIEFGKNISPEMSYIHMGIVINCKGKYLYVLPITTFSSANKGHKNAYHPVHNYQNYNKELALMPKSEFSFLDHDSVIKLNDLKTISTKRFRKYIAHLDKESIYFRRIIDLSFSQIYSLVYSEKVNLQKQFDSLKNSYDILIEETKKSPDEINKIK